ncbi:hypothetical protein MHYP_G00169860 [Metynnis hypsauchen]
METLLDEVAANVEQLLREPVKSLLSAKSEAIRDLTEVLLEDAEPHSADPGEERNLVPDIRKTTQLENLAVFIHVEEEEERKIMMMADEAEAEAIKALMDIDLDENEEEPLEKHLDHLVSSKDEATEAIKKLLKIQVEEVIEPVEKRLDHLVSSNDEATEAIKKLLKIQVEEVIEPVEKRLDHLEKRRSTAVNDSSAELKTEERDILLNDRLGEFRVY